MCASEDGRGTANHEPDDDDDDLEYECESLDDCDDDSGYSACGIVENMVSECDVRMMMMMMMMQTNE